MKRWAGDDKKGPDPFSKGVRPLLFSERGIFRAAFGLFGILCLKHYWNQRPLWGDEQIVLASLQGFSVTQLLHETLLHMQAFPRMWGVLVKTIAEPFGYHVLSLRAVSFLAVITAFAVWAKIARDAFGKRSDWALFMFTWSASIMMIYYAAELKPYAVDTLIGSVYVYVITRPAATALRGRPLIILMPFLCLFSFTTFLFWPLYVLALFYRVQARPDDRWMLPAAVGSMVVSAGLFYGIDYRNLNHNLNKASLIEDYFIYTDSVGNFLKTTSEGLNNLFSRWFADHPRLIRKVSRVFVIFGMLYLFIDGAKHIRRIKSHIGRLSVVGLVVLMELMILGGLKIYPFVIPRTVLFFAPFVFYATIHGIDYLNKRSVWAYRVVKYSYVVFLSVVCLGLAKTVFGGDLGAQSVIW